ncbi:MAG: ATP-dependent metalloprotease, partial [Arsukibacterium sp.]|nr:ATP-dependent metalloprotease [Arsukibacterium sp.]
LGRSVSKNKHMSEDTVKAIDAEIRAFIDRNYVRAKKLIEDNMDILHAMKDALMKYETIDAKQIDDLMARRDVRQPENWEPRDKGNDDNDGTGKAKTESEGPVATDKPSEGNLH